MIDRALDQSNLLEPKKASNAAITIDRRTQTIKHESEIEEVKNVR